jgi:protein-tyrosine-phosphatase
MAVPVGVASAGTEDHPHVVRPVVRDYLLEKGLDVSRHVRRTLTAALLDESDLTIAMSTEHREFLASEFGCEAPLFTQACGLAADALPDVDQVIPDFESNPAAVAAHVRTTIDRIVELTPRLAARIVHEVASRRSS